MTTLRFVKAVPNVLVADMTKSIAFYRDVLGFEQTMTVPEEAPFVFVGLQRGDVEIFLNDAATAQRDFPPLAGRALGGTNTIYVKLEGGLEAYHEQVRARTPLAMPFTRQPYGMTEFAVTDPDGYVIFFAEENPR
jgi:uncharacterized glyoxalase superfamily protein PhnB